MRVQACLWSHQKLNVLSNKTLFAYKLSLGTSIKGPVRLLLTIPFPFFQIMEAMNETSVETEILCEEPSASAIQIYDTVAWLFENVLQTCIGLAGIMANSLAIPILCSKEMSSIFNRLLGTKRIPKNSFSK